VIIRLTSHTAIGLRQQMHFKYNVVIGNDANEIPPSLPLSPSELQAYHYTGIQGSTSEPPQSFKNNDEKQEGSESPPAYNPIFAKESSKRRLWSK